MAVRLSLVALWHAGPSGAAALTAAAVAAAEGCWKDKLRARPNERGLRRGSSLSPSLPPSQQPFMCVHLSTTEIIASSIYKDYDQL